MVPKDFINNKSKFVLEKFFERKKSAYGIYEDRFGRVKRQLLVDIEGCPIAKY